MGVESSRNMPALTHAAGTRLRSTSCAAGVTAAQEAGMSCSMWSICATRSGVIIEFKQHEKAACNQATSVFGHTKGTVFCMTFA